MVFLNNKFLSEKEAKISVLDRGFLFGDGIYEVIPVYNNKIFKLEEHLTRLNKSLNAVKIPNPYKASEYKFILEKLLSYSDYPNSKIYLQITRGISTSRNHTLEELEPTIYIRVDEFKPKAKSQLQEVRFSAIIKNDNRWQNCFIKSTSLLANVLYVMDAKEKNIEEIILHRDGIITEGASSNVFMAKNNIIYTPPHNNFILNGVTRNMAIKSIIKTGLTIKEQNINKEDLLLADEVWITSSTREIMPITKIDSVLYQPPTLWEKVYDNFQLLKDE